MTMNDCNCGAQDRPDHNPHLNECAVYATTESTAAPWGRSKDAVPPGHTQITIYDEKTGDRIATVFNEPDSYLVQASPDMCDALMAAKNYIERLGRPLESGYHEEWREVLGKLNKSLNKARPY